MVVVEHIGVKMEKYCNKELLDKCERGNKELLDKHAQYEFF